MKFKSITTSGGSKNYLKLKDKEFVKGIFRGEPEEFYVKWENGKSSSVPEGTEKASFRFRLNFVTNENGTYVAKIWESSATVYQALAALSQDYNLEETVVKISRNGTGTDTIYMVTPLPDKVSEAMKKQIASVDLHDLTTKSQTNSQLVDEDNIPF